MMRQGHTRSRPRPVLEVIRGNIETLPKRFWSKVNITDDEDGCWEWQRTKVPQGYGQLDKAAAHRIAYWLATGVDPAEHEVLHRCDNPPCVRPSHLRLGTHADNMADAAAKNRIPGHVTHSDQTVADILSLWQAGWTSYAIGERLGVSSSHVRRLVSGRSRTTAPTTAPWMAEEWRKHPGQKLPDEQVQEIRRRYATEGITQRALAAEYGIHQGYVSKIVNHKERAA